MEVRSLFSLPKVKQPDAKKMIFVPKKGDVIYAGGTLVIGGGGKKGKGGSIIIIGGGGGSGKSKGGSSGGWGGGGGGMLKKFIWEISVKKISEKMFKKPAWDDEIHIEWM